MSSTEGEEEEESGFDPVVEGEVEHKWVYCAFVRRDTALPREKRVRSGRVGGNAAYDEGRTHTQTVQIVMMAFISRLRWAIALRPGWPPLRVEGAGILRTL